MSGSGSPSCLGVESPTAKAMNIKIEEVVARVRSFGITLLKYMVRYVWVGKGRYAAVFLPGAALLIFWCARLRRKLPAATMLPAVAMLASMTVKMAKGTHDPQLPD